MVGKNGSGSPRALRILKISITDSEVLNAITPMDMENLAHSALENISDSEIRMCLIKCFDNKREDVGIVLANNLIEYVEALLERGDETRANEILGATIAGLAYGSSSSKLATKKIRELFGHKNPRIIVRVVKKLPTTLNTDNFREVCKLLVHSDFFVRRNAIGYAEKSITGAAFSGGNTNREEQIDEFMRSALIPLESAYEEIKKHPDSAHIQKRLAILVAMVYNEILDTLDSKEEMCAQNKTADAIYSTWEQHLNQDIGPEAIPALCKMLEYNKGPDERIEICALNTLGRMSNSKKNSEKIIRWIQTYLGQRPAGTLLNVAREIWDAKIVGKRFASIPPVADKGRVVGKSLIPPPMKK